MRDSTRRHRRDGRRCRQRDRSHGRLVTSAALILFLSFVALSTAPSTQVKMIATGLGAGILIDATIIRALLVPAVVSLFGRWNWWLPRLPARLLRVEASPIAVEG
jgi:putative drug exporter of the RND superfamily